MIIVSDTTPVHYLIQIGKIEILKQLFERVIIPEAVLLEMQHEKTPEDVKAWIRARPKWIEVRKPSPEAIAAIRELGKGEQEAIALAVELNADALLIDERKGLREAVRNNIAVITTFNILESGAKKKLLDLKEAIEKLSKTNFRMPPEGVINALLAREAERES